MKSLQIIYLTFNEEVNIQRSLENIIHYGFDNITLLDSGSTDKTTKIAENLNIGVRQHKYIDHCHTYNNITKNREFDYYMILDADVYFTIELAQHVKEILKSNGQFDVYKARVDILLEGIELKFGNVYPNKPILFKSGKEYFVQSGHGEELNTDNFSLLRGKLKHDDRKPYNLVIEKQFRYIDKAYKIYQNQIENANSPIKDKMRFTSGLWIVITFIYVYIYKLGFLSGRIGVLYIVNRLIAELLYYRKGLVERLKAERDFSNTETIE